MEPVTIFLILTAIVNWGIAIYGYTVLRRIKRNWIEIEVATEEIREVLKDRKMLKDKAEAALKDGSA